MQAIKDERRYRTKNRLTFHLLSTHSFDEGRNRATYRFDDPFLPGAAVFPGLAEELDVLRQDEGPGEKAELLFAKATLHLRQIPPQPVLPANLECPREVVQLGQNKTQTQPSHASSCRPPQSEGFPGGGCAALTFWCSARVLKHGDFMWCPQQPSQSWLPTGTPVSEGLHHTLTSSGSVTFRMSGLLFLLHLHVFGISIK